jgi:hypothetical protein
MSMINSFRRGLSGKQIPVLKGAGGVVCPAARAVRSTSAPVNAAAHPTTTYGLANGGTDGAIIADAGAIGRRRTRANHGPVEALGATMGIFDNIYLHAKILGDRRLNPMVGKGVLSGDQKSRIGGRQSRSFGSSARKVSATLHSVEAQRVHSYDLAMATDALPMDSDLAELEQILRRMKARQRSWRQKKNPAEGGSTTDYVDSNTDRVTAKTIPDTETKTTKSGVSTAESVSSCGHGGCEDVLAHHRYLRFNVLGCHTLAFTK